MRSRPAHRDFRRPVTADFQPKTDRAPAPSVEDMNRSTYDNAVPPTRHPARLAAGALGAVLLLLGLVPLAERLLAHLEVWSLALPSPALTDLALAAAGAVALLLALRSRSVPAPGRPDPQER